MQDASISPYPNEWEKFLPKAFTAQSVALRLAGCAHLQRDGDRGQLGK